MTQRIEDPWGPRTPYDVGDRWPVRVDMQLEDRVAEPDVERWVPSASVLHSNGDAMDIAVKDGRIAEGQTARQLQWLRTRMQQAAPQALVVA
jgi:hypothetical protein